MSQAPYRPKSLTAAQWAEIEPFVRSAVGRVKADEASAYAEKKLLTHVTAHVAWCRFVAFYPLEDGIVFDREVIGESIERGFPGCAKTTLATRRSALLYVAQYVLPMTERTPRLRPLRDDKVCAPYTVEEQVTLRSWAAGQVTPQYRRNCQVILSLGLGAGLGAADMMRLRVGDIEIDKAGVLLDLQHSKNPRYVAVLADWEQALIDLKATTNPGDLALGVERTNEENKNYVSNFIARTSAEDGLRPNSDSLRNTWLLRHLLAGTPVGPLLAAAGLVTLRQLEKLLPFVPVASKDDVRRTMRRALRAL